MPTGRRGLRPYTPAVRRWVCIIALLFGFSGESYAWCARPRVPVPMERVLDDSPVADLPRTAWWGIS